MPFSMPKSGERSVVLRRELDRILPLLVTEDVEKIILFGSFVDEMVSSTSDLDIIVIENTGMRFMDRIGTLYEKLQPRVALDLLVYTPEEFDTMRTGSSFLRRALEKSRIVYEKKCD